MLGFSPIQVFKGNGEKMKKFLTGLAVFATTSLTGVLAASADGHDYPPSAGTGGTPNLPETGASVLQDTLQYGNVALILGLGLLGAIAVRRRSIQN
jgi:hypothetical protein